jgi:hypothetical protein
MPKFQIKVKDKTLYDKVSKAYTETEILKRPTELHYGRWDFVVFGPSGKDEVILRQGYAEHASIRRAPIYVASLSAPGGLVETGVPIEEFITEDVPEEYQGLEIVHIDPVRPLNIQKKQTLPKSTRIDDKITLEYETQDIAVIRAPSETDWMIAVLRYLHECDRTFPDSVQERLKNFRTMLSGSSGGYAN